MLSFLKNKLIHIFLKIKGAKIGKNVFFESIPVLNNSSDRIKLDIDNDVYFGKDVELFFRGNGLIKISKGVKIDNNVRLLVANVAVLQIDESTKVGKNTVINAGDDVYMGKNCLISVNCYIQSSSHKFDKIKNIKDQ